MASLDSLPADQRAVLQLLLQRGRTYEQIAAMLSIDRAGVRQRALSALDALGPQTGVPHERRALITDYLLGQLPPRVSATTRDQLGDSPTDRAWARVVASELSTIASGALPEIPVEPSRREETRDEAPEQFEPDGRAAGPSVVPASAAASAPASPPAGGPAGASASEERPKAPEGQPSEPSHRRSSLRGGAVLLGLALVVIAVAIVLIASGGESKKPASTSTTAASTPTTTPATGSSTGATTSPQILRQINLRSPAAPQTRTSGLAEVLKQGNIDGIAIVAQNVTPNTKHDAYAVWLYNSPTDSHILGYVNPGVGTNGRLSTAGPLPSTASHYKRLIVTLETQSNPSVPGKIILQGAFSLG